MGYGRRYLREAEPQMGAPPRTDPIEHRATRGRPTQSADGNVALRGVGSTELPLRPPRWPLTECTFSWKPHRKGVRQDQEPAAQGRSQEQGDFIRCDRRGAICHHCRRRPGLLRACRIPFFGSPTVKRAVRVSLASQFCSAFMHCFLLLRCPKIAPLDLKLLKITSSFFRSHVSYPLGSS